MSNTRIIIFLDPCFNFCRHIDVPWEKMWTRPWSLPQATAILPSRNIPWWTNTLMWETENDSDGDVWGNSYKSNPLVKLSTSNYFWLALKDTLPLECHSKYHNSIFMVIDDANAWLQHLWPIVYSSSCEFWHPNSLISASPFCVEIGLCNLSHGFQID